jgi:hypothetical protein
MSGQASGRRIGLYSTLKAAVPLADIALTVAIVSAW